MRYVFGDLTRSLFAQSPLESLGPPSSDGVDVKLAAAMNGAWMSFARSGNPNADGLPEWPRIRPERPQYLEYGDVIRIGDEPIGERLRFFADFYRREGVDETNSGRH
jgi:para-nitrobenzyl esterase